MTGYEPRVRAADEDDLPELERLGELAVDHVRTQKGGDVFLLRDARSAPGATSLADDVRAALRSPGTRTVLLGSLGASAVGFATATVVPTPGAPLAVVEELYVEPAARRVGLGHLLMRTLVDWAVAAGCGGIDADALPGDRDTKNFFEGFGLVARKITVHRTFGTDGV